MANVHLLKAIFVAGDPTGLAEITDIDTVVGLQLAALNSGQLAGIRNRVINGGFNVWQRGVSFTASGYTADMWKFNNGGGACPTITKTTGVYFDTCESAIYTITGIATNAGLSIEHRIEAINSKDLAGKIVTVSAWIYQDSGATKTHTTYVGYETVTADAFSTVSYLSFNTSVQSGQWTFCSGQISLPTSATKGISIQLGNGLGGCTAGVSFKFGNTQLEPGLVATPFEFRPYSIELDMCQRYYETSAGNGEVETSTHPFIASNSTNQPTFVFKVGKRVAPTMTYVLGGGTGATFVAGKSAFYQSTANSINTPFGWTASAPL